MKFTVVTNDAGRSQSTTKSSVDWDKINAEKAAREAAIIEMLETQNESISLSGVVSSYVDLGQQKRDDYQEVYDPNNDKHAEKLTKDSVIKDLYNDKLGKVVPTLCTPSKPAKAFVLGIDFPQYMVDYGGEIGQRPLRVFMGGKFFVKNPDSAEDKKMAIVQDPMYMSENTNNPQGRWALPVNTKIAKMCVAAGLADKDGLVTKDEITKLLGKALQFELRIWNKLNTKKGTTHYTESIKFVGKLPKGMPEPVLDEKSIFGVNMMSANDPEMIKQLRAEHKNTMKLALNWEGSVLQRELSELRNSNQQSPSQTPAEAPEKHVTVSSQPANTMVAPQPVNTVASVSGGLDEGWDDDKYPF